METWENIEPLKCPFCGAFGKGDLIELKQKSENNLCCVYCKFCGAIGPEAIDFTKAVIKWNRRTK